jgi:putative hydrolase of the HAD superfamily
MIRTILFDLDDTLYPRQAGVMGQIGTLMLRYIRSRFGLSAEEAEELRMHYFQTYGTTMRGLQVNHQIDPDEFLHYVHDIPLHRYLQTNPELDEVLSTIPQEKVIFTNASREHAERVLDQLGIRHHFARIIDVRDMDYESKPQPRAYRRVCEILGVEPQECVLVEDNLRNLRPAKELGMTTILIGDGRTAVDGSVDSVLLRVEEIGRVMAELEPPS